MIQVNDEQFRVYANSYNDKLNVKETNSFSAGNYRRFYRLALFFFLSFVESSCF